MKNSTLTILLALGVVGACGHSDASIKNELRIVIIRHGEKSNDDNNLSCKGLNRSWLLPAVVYRKFGIPSKIYVPSIEARSTTKHLRMMQTVTPLAVTYHVQINTRYDENDYDRIAKALSRERGLVVVAWEHGAIQPIIHALVPSAGNIRWRDDDYDTICIISFKGGKPFLTFDAEHINPSTVTLYGRPNDEITDLFIIIFVLLFCRSICGWL
jgi:hypothetical protein